MLTHQLTGDVLRPGAGRYDEARLLFDRRFDGIRPQAVVQVRSAADVARTIDFATHHGIALATRAGGHSYLGASTGPGIVVDLRALDTVTHSGGIATIGAGAALVDVYSQLAARGVSIPAGSCPTVGLAGLTLGGGIGVVARKYGVTCDRLAAATVVTADGTTIQASQEQHGDLLWALRGGGGSFGVVTELQLHTHPTRQLAHAFVTWPWAAAVDVVESWQDWAAHGPRELWSGCHVLATDDPTGPPSVSAVAVYVGDESGLSAQLETLLESVGTPAQSRSVASAGYEQTMMLEAGCATTSVAACHVRDETPGGTLPRDAFVAGSDFFAQPLPTASVHRLVGAVQQRQGASRLGAGGASLDLLGGAVDDVAPSAAAFVHRGALFDAQYTASWQHTPGNGPLAANRRSLAAIRATLHEAATGAAYQNYPDASLHDPQRAYYGANLSRLVEIRRRYDPNGVFTQPQGVPLR
jgi:FAD/FMN-containing dehydrogenase